MASKIIPCHRQLVILDAILLGVLLEATLKNYGIGTYALNGCRDFLCLFCKEIPVSVRVGIRCSCSMNLPIEHIGLSLR